MTSGAGAKDDAGMLELGDGAGKPVRGDEDEGGMGVADERGLGHRPWQRGNDAAIAMHCSCTTHALSCTVHGNGLCGAQGGGGARGNSRSKGRCQAAREQSRELLRLLQSRCQSFGLLCRLSDGKWHIWFHFNGRNPVKRGIYERDISFVTLVSLIANEGYGESDFMYYVKEGETGIEGVKYLSTEGSAKEMSELYHHQKVPNIEVLKDGEPDSRTQSVDNYMNTHQI
ncbi:hypothetical protein D1007_43834 [Hordeum vulgare]|nr:hypothetical protein D1007_43834 [Hordeum vulgare]